jgi:VWFA-related protein
MKSGKLARFLLIVSVVTLSAIAHASPLGGGLPLQDGKEKKKARGTAKPMTIPVGVKVRGTAAQPEMQVLDLTVSEDGEPQSVLSIRAIGPTTPITLAVLIQDDLVSSASNEIKPIAEFIRHLPQGSRVMVGYVRSGSLEVRQKFTPDLTKAAAALRIPLGLASAGPYNPYVEVLEGIARFESQPTGRRSLLLVSDGLDVSRGVDSSEPTQSIDLQRAINQAQRRGIAIYSFYVPSVALNQTGNGMLIGNAQSSLQRLSSETGGRAFFQGMGAPVSFDPFLRDLNSSLEKQLAVTYLSTHTSKGFHKLQIRSSTPGVELSYPVGYVK